jgi:hypothetical protein
MGNKVWEEPTAFFHIQLRSVFGYVTSATETIRQLFL